MHECSHVGLPLPAYLVTKCADLDRNRGNLSRRRLRMVPVGTETAAHDRRADPFLADEVVHVGRVIDLGYLPVNDVDDRLAVGTAASDLEAAPDKRNAERHAADVLVLELVREDLGPRIQALRPGWNAGAGLQRLGIHADNCATPLHGDLMAGSSTRTNQKHDERQWPCSRRRATSMPLVGIVIDWHSPPAADAMDRGEESTYSPGARRRGWAQ